MFFRGPLDSLFDYIYHLPLRKYASHGGISYFSISLGQLIPNVQELVRSLRQSAIEQRAITRNILQKAQESERSLTAEMYVRELYDAEYGAHTYAVIHALSSPNGFELITGIPLKDTFGKSIADIGVGSGEFPRFLLSQGVRADNVTAIDVSKESIRGLQDTGIHVFEGRIEESSLEGKSQDFIFLSYFLDYDTDQYATFSSAIAKIAPGGKIILECLLPCTFRIPGVPQKKAVTRGKSVSDDVQRLDEAFKFLGAAQNRQVKLERIVATKRWLKNRWGVSELTSYFFAFSVS